MRWLIKGQDLQRDIDVYNKHINKLAFYNLIVRENYVFNNMHEKNEITIRCLVKVDMPLKENDGIQQTNLWYTLCEVL